ncbi:hypothetical protein CSOJ01_06886 [Colletotrichum sojae]|uniref:Uncharacterized protein n=1 Tax=Colletotrichum sojae TaxID=2175907 RepID=A0A8H6MV66_9PEZI|nr:hypothetical protein CSOJ01_06886 [Colletotrichum sojae]
MWEEEEPMTSTTMMDWGAVTSEERSESLFCWAKQFLLPAQGFRPSAALGLVWKSAARSMTHGGGRTMVYGNRSGQAEHPTPTMARHRSMNTISGTEVTSAAAEANSDGPVRRSVKPKMGPRRSIP